MKRTSKILKSILKYIGLVLLLLIAAVLVSIPISRFSSKSPITTGEKLEKMAIRNVHVVPMDSNYVRNNQTLLIENGKITKIQSDSLIIPSDFKILEGNGKYVVPGLKDMHAHIFDRTDLSLYLSYGVTTVRNMMGFPMHLRWRKEVASHEFVGSTMVTASPTINMGDDTGGPFHKVVEDSAQASEAVKKYYERGYDFIKIYDGLNEDGFAGVMAEANKLNMDVAGHPPYHVSLDHILNSKIVSIEHVEEVFQGLLHFKYNDSIAHNLARSLKAHNTVITVTLSAYYNLYRTVVDKDAFLSGIPTEYITPMIRLIGEKQLEGWKTTSKESYDWTVKKYVVMERLVSILREEGVTFLLGTDTGPNLTVPGLTLHDEMQLLSGLGLSNYEILVSGTREAARVLHQEGDKGILTEGVKADFLLVNNNPLEDLNTLRAPEGIFTNGRMYSHKDLQDLKAFSRDHHASYYITLGRFLEQVFTK